VPADPANGYSIVATPTDEVGNNLLYSYQIQLNGTSRVSGAGPHTISVAYDFDQPASVDPLQVDIQEGANEGEVTGVQIARLTVGGLGLAASHIDTQLGAENTLTALNRSIDRMNAIRAGIGAYESSLDHAYTNVLNTNINQDAARSRIRDADMANEATEVARASILRDGAMSTIMQITTHAGLLVKLLS
jgi:flagellin-like hook-associated protein FlgL